MTGTDGAVSEGLGKMAFSGAAGTDDQHGDLFGHEPAGGQLHDQGAVDVGIEGKIELLQGLLVAEVGPADGRGQSFLRPAGDLVLDDGGQKIHVGKLLLDGLTVAGFDGIQDAGQPQLLEHGNQFGHGVHHRFLLSQCNRITPDWRRKRPLPV